MIIKKSVARQETGDAILCNNGGDMEKEDKELIADYLEGDEQALAILIERYTKAIYNFTYRMTGNASDADDITQETFLKVWRNLKRYRPGENFRTWLYAIARNATIDHLRKRKQLSFADFERDDTENMFAETVPDTLPLPDEIFIKNERAEVLEKALMEISPLYREVLFLRYNEQLTFDEIGKVLGRPLHTVKSQHRRALIALEKLLKGAKNELL